jgi:hypothetical protein
MSSDDIDSVVLKLHDFLFRNLGCALDEDEDYELLSNFMHNELESFVTRDRNYN